MPGIWVVDGVDLRISDIRLELGAEGLVPSSPKLDLRLELWRYWLIEAVSAAIEAAGIAPKLSAEVLATDREEAAQLLINEFRASMRAITSAAFAIDAFYASVKVRSPDRPCPDAWSEKRPSRHQQVAETLKHHLRITKNDQSKEISKRVKEIFGLRNSAVHPGSRFKNPAYREDLDAHVDWHFKAFCATNAVAGVAKTVQLLDFLVAVLDRGSKELAEWKPYARSAMNQILDTYEASDKLIPIDRVEPSSYDV
ncbi:hypothetical protein [Mycobacteroides chelonae]|uniref:hypothetical protein n=1 Tax=Mycobacteroides chelonae TaxID=1774 RepID=UPI0009BD7A69|nr:hypothetical protein [Mycobacteroides chelonae]AYM41160.1 hypothetical protein DYE20_06000 [[Mycobacterium] chelonae subsp. gwanakae]GLE56082.1 hypothetical protein NJBCHELONAE_13900 [Mycobacteroides chelonae]